MCVLVHHGVAALTRRAVHRLPDRFVGGGRGSHFLSAGSATGRVYDVSADGKRILMVKQPKDRGQTAAASIVVVRNWIEEVKTLVAAGR
jgi:hypothetical protein